MCGNGVVVTDPFLKNVLVNNFYRPEVDKWALYSVLENILSGVQFIYCFKVCVGELICNLTQK